MLRRLPNTTHVTFGSSRKIPLLEAGEHVLVPYGLQNVGAHSSMAKLHAALIDVADLWGRPA